MTGASGKYNRDQKLFSKCDIDDICDIPHNIPDDQIFDDECHK